MNLYIINFFVEENPSFTFEQMHLYTNERENTTKINPFN